MIDRLTHHAKIISIDGECYGKRQAEQTQKRKQDQNRSGDHAAMLIGSVQNYAVLHERQQWDYSSEEFQWILKLGVWTRSQIEHETALGDEIRDKFHAYELHRHGRRRHSS